MINIFRSLFRFISKLRKPQKARYIVIKTVIDNEPVEYHFHIIFTLENDYWVAKVLENNNVVIYDQNFEHCYASTIDALLCDIKFANKHGFLNEAFIPLDAGGIKKWKEIRRREGLSVEPCF